MYAPQTPCEGVSAIHLISATLSSTYQMASPSKTPRSGPRESPFPGAKEALTTQQAKAFGTIPQEISISSAKPGITALVCLSFVYKQSFLWLMTVRVSRRACHGATDPSNINNIKATVL